MDGKLLARIGAIVFVAVAITATAIEMTRKEAEPVAPVLRPAVIAVTSDPLRDQLIGCARMGEAGTRDATCLRAWAENRARFLAPGKQSIEPLPGSPLAPQTDPLPTPPIADDPIHKEMAPALELQSEEAR
ncbi:putative entry exclusion protein TrbK-alt [Aurantimonas aggregata]|uniref:Putative entry exclusion protein TrbK-alt n=1 Tax=Aurantimonas aggregata TaxID=2047720 RepID=A0A6L9MN96_9HYPH|nr:putative entry exclusion protein TrbK-alt [Aurantimonas aggregata]NDV89241.1 putative entry exclusion protein TrbK-alt [Aurantimonas aggregata]